MNQDFVKEIVAEADARWGAHYQAMADYYVARIDALEAENARLMERSMSAYQLYRNASLEQALRDVRFELVCHGDFPNTLAKIDAALNQE